MNQLSHYNDNTRQDATESLKHFFIQYPASLHQNLSIFLPKLLSRSVDVHFNVRKNFISCLEHVFKNVTKQEIQPFYPVIMAHLSCAMTHINEEIQSDSLKLLDLCLDWFPSLFLKSCDKVFHNFLDMVSQSQGSSIKKHCGTKNGTSQPFSINTSMSVKPIGKLSSMKSRKDALEKLQKMVSLVLTMKRTQNLHVESDCNQGNVNMAGNDFLLLKYSYFDNQKREKLDRIPSTKRETVSSNSLESMKGLILSFMPILFHFWNDCNPASFTSSSASKANELALPIMVSIVSIFKAVATSEPQGKHSNSFTGDYFEDFEKYVLEYFPFSIYTLQNKPVKPDLQSNILNLNSSICQIFCKVLVSSPSRANDSSDNLEKILNYLKSIILCSRGSKKLDQLGPVQETVSTLIEAFLKLRSKGSNTQGKAQTLCLNSALHFVTMNLKLKTFSVNLDHLAVKGDSDA